ncbi:hypothetical protein LOC71_02050 [Rhodopirellula sp. JC740]|uniref:Uncharacterized protein n=1 Tax=Rhodopirellula halodulae TaxID=2894198 RepID=A0ABS8NBY6_9BACT|nr:hypothetical protein [Rhodopirellula sp. JC740]MCC9641039.1 hypothetical protein [Rhodopirellula sp. JC740]
MAVRLNVIVLRPEGDHRHFDPACDDAVGQLLGRPGLDLVLLDRIPGPNDAGTERLAVESIAGDIACVAWTDADRVSQPLALLGKRVARVPHRRDVDAPTPNEEGPIAKLYHFDMRRDGAQQTILNDLQTLLATRQTPTFQIGSTGDRKPRAAATKPEKASSQKSPAVVPMVSPTPVVREVPRSTSASHAKTNLDALVDELDELDL